MLHLYYQTDAVARHTAGTLIGALINLPKLGRDRIEVGRLPRCQIADSSRGDCSFLSEQVSRVPTVRTVGWDVWRTGRDNYLSSK
jgi:hypothetical protein